MIDRLALHCEVLYLVMKSRSQPIKFTLKSSIPSRTVHSPRFAFPTKEEPFLPGLCASESLLVFAAARQIETPRGSIHFSCHPTGQITNFVNDYTAYIRARRSRPSQQQRSDADSKRAASKNGTRYALALVCVSRRFRKRTAQLVTDKRHLVNKARGRGGNQENGGGKAG